MMLSLYLAQAAAIFKPCSAFGSCTSSVFLVLRLQVALELSLGHELNISDFDLFSFYSSIYLFVFVGMKLVSI